MKSHNDMIQLVAQVLTDFERNVAEYSHRKDLCTIRSRFEHEGLSFLTITLPQFGQDVTNSLANGCIDSNAFRSFRKRGAIPAFLQGMTSQVFDVRDGRILDKPSIAAIMNIRQVCLMFKKILLPCTVERNNDAIKKFKEDEQVFDEQLADSDIREFVECSGILWGPFASRDLVGWFDEIRCKHGPGATVDRLKGNHKFLMPLFHKRLESYFPILGHVFSENAWDHRDLENVQFVDEESEEPVKVTLVPKTLKTPRIIAIEPACMQYTQQGLSTFLVDKLKHYELTSGHLNFDDQSINAELALSSSRTQEFATLDLSSASDRVPFDLAMRMFDWNPDFRDAIIACRSRRAKLPTGEVLNLRKFASMGSALCFPIEAMYFYTICIIGLMRDASLPYTHSNVKRIARRVFIYGDDIIVPTRAATAVVDTLHKYYCKVGTAKSFWNGKFRESCGVDAYDGVNVTPIYIRHTRPYDRDQASAIISYCSASNKFYEAGLWLTAALLQEWVEQLVGKLPIVLPGCSGLGVHSFQRRFSIDRWSKRYQRPEVRAMVPSPCYEKSRINGYPALTKCLTRLNNLNNRGLSDEPLPPEVAVRKLMEIAASDKQHLERGPRHGAVVLKSRWVDPALPGSRG